MLPWFCSFAEVCEKEATSHLCNVALSSAIEISATERMVGYLICHIMINNYKKCSRKSILSSVSARQTLMECLENSSY
jgi:hypothetical protein